ncbi:MAG: DNA polymerase III subunit [Gemmatimonadetes bacterium]|nr:DNA polymerase III subunit [Gemmatimonadota bacterium]MBT7862011.1 DNA polymerase III subunit [Gemmatimonadota bacterium]
MSLASVTGQERAKAQIDAWLSADRLPHAILVTGPLGAGKRRLSLELAKAINCRTPGPDACDECSSCRKADTLTHPNLHVLLPLPTGSRGSDSETMSSLRETALEQISGNTTASRTGTNISKESIRLLQKEMSFAPTEAPHRVGLILQAESMLAAGANSLLKILEEPPGQSIFILVSDTPDRLLPTILSRCQRLHLRPLSLSEQREQLQRAGIDDERADLAARLAASGRIRAEDVIDGDQFDELRDLVRRFLVSAIQSAEDDYWKVLEDLGGRPDRQRLEGFLQLCSAYLRDLFLVQQQQADAVANIDEQEALQQWATAMLPARIERVAQVLDQAYESLSRNVHPQLLLADLWYHLQRARAA